MWEALKVCREYFKSKFRIWIAEFKEIIHKFRISDEGQTISKVGPFSNIIEKQVSGFASTFFRHKGKLNTFKINEEERKIPLELGVNPGSIFWISNKLYLWVFCLIFPSTFIPLKNNCLQSWLTATRYKGKIGSLVSFWLSFSSVTNKVEDVFLSILVVIMFIKKFPPSNKMGRWCWIKKFSNLACSKHSWQTLERSLKPNIKSEILLLVHFLQ